MQPALQDEPRRSRGVLGPSLAENRPETDPQISGQTAFRYPTGARLELTVGALTIGGQLRDVASQVGPGLLCRPIDGQTYRRVNLAQRRRPLGLNKNSYLLLLGGPKPPQSPSPGPGIDP